MQCNKDAAVFCVSVNNVSAIFTWTYTCTYTVLGSVTAWTVLSIFSTHYYGRLKPVGVAGWTSSPSSYSGVFTVEYSNRSEEKNTDKKNFDKIGKKEIRGRRTALRQTYRN